MENASKAIIIGGSVLISILIVSLGIYIYNSTKDTTGTAAEAAETLEVQIYNQKFEKYIESYIRQNATYANGVLSGKNFKALVAEAIASKSDIIIQVSHESSNFGGSYPFTNKVEFVDAHRPLNAIYGYIKDNTSYYFNLDYDENGRLFQMRID